MKPLIELLPPQIQHKTREIQIHQKVLEAALQGSPVRQCRAGGISGTTLTVLCQTAADASSLRYVENTIVAAFDAHCPGLIKRIHVRLKSEQGMGMAPQKVKEKEKSPPKTTQKYKAQLRETLKRLEE